MSNRIYPRKTSIDIRYNGVKVKQKLMSKLQSFGYVDCANGESDTISLEFEDIAEKWLNSWIPVKGDLINAFIYTSNWMKQGEQITFNCGEFLVDDFSISNSPMVCNINAISSPLNKAFSATKRTVVWENVSIEAIVSTIAGKSDLKYVYDAEYWKISSIEQSEETDSEFLCNLCNKYGLSMKVYSNKIIVFDREKYKAKATVVTLKRKDIITFKYSDALEGSYTGGKISYTNSNGDEIVYSFGEAGRILELNEKADSKFDAEKIIKAAVQSANHSVITLTLSIMPNLKIVAGVCIQVNNLGRLSGKYYVDKVTHNRSGSSGYTMELDLSKVR